jgi:hypothetical protein
LSDNYSLERTDLVIIRMRSRNLPMGLIDWPA